MAKIVNRHPVRGFPGYVDHDSTRKKILNSVWSEGDHCFKSGDILVADKYGWFYFVDRIGDTFRWKGENVSTTEVEAVINSFNNTMTQVNFITIVVFKLNVKNTLSAKANYFLHETE